MLNSKVELVAEIAQGYEGNPKLAELLVKGALEAGADAVKIQLVYADELAIPTYPYYGLFKSLEMPDAEWDKIAATIRKAGRKLYFDIYGDLSLQLARRLGADGVKISTTDFYNGPLLKSAFSHFPQVFVSVGGVPAEDLDEMVNSIAVREKVTLMHGFQAEPTETQDNHLARIPTLLKRYPGARVGFMDHSLGSSDDAFYLPLLALGQGVTCIEKHITLDYLLQIEDYISALSPERFRKFVQVIRSMEPALGSKDLVLNAKEIEYKNRAGKVVVANRDLQKGQRVEETDIAMKRVGVTGNESFFRRVSPIVGRTLATPIQKDRPFEEGSFA